MKKIHAVAVLALAALLLGGCLVHETNRHGLIPEVNQQKVLANHVDLAFRYLKQGNRDLARNHLEAALEIDPQSSGAFTCYALIYEQEGEDQLAEESFLKAIKYGDSDTRTQFYYGVFLNSRERIQEARSQFARVTENVDYPHRALAFVSLAKADLKLGNESAARSALEKSLRLNPRSAAVYLELADLEYVAGRYDSARGYLDQYNQLNRSSARSLWLGVRLENRFKNKDVEASYGMALKNLFPNSKENLAYQEWLEHAQ